MVLVAQLVEHLPVEQRVVGSIPIKHPKIVSSFVQHPKLILFDIDHTLVAGRAADVYYRRFPWLVRDAFARHLGIEYERAKEYVERHLAFLEGRAPADLDARRDFGLERWYDAIVRVDPSEFLKPMPSIVAMLETLRNEGYALGIVTDSPTPQAERVLDAIGVHKNIFRVFVGWERGKKIPKDGTGEVFERVCGAFGCAPSEALMTGDSLLTDILPAHRLGLAVVHISPVKPDHIFPFIPSVESLPAYLRGI